MDLLYSGFIGNWCPILMPLLGALFGLWWWDRERDERWERMLGDLRNTLPEAVRGSFPQFGLANFPTSEELGSWRREIDDAQQGALELERQVASKETELSLRTVECERAKHNVAERARELTDLERKLAGAESTYGVHGEQLEELKRALLEKERLRVDLERRLGAAEAARTDEESALGRTTAAHRDTTDRLGELRRALEEERQACRMRDGELERVNQGTSQLAAKVDDLRQRDAATLATATSLTEEVTAATAERNGVNDKLAQLARQLTESRAAAEEARATAEEALAERDPMRALFERESQQLADARHRAELLGPRRDGLKTREAEMQAQIQALLEEIERLEQRIRESEAAVLGAEDQLARLRREQSDLEKSLATEVARHDGLITALGKDKADLKRREERIAALKARQETAVRVHAERLAELERELEGLRAAVAQKREAARLAEARENELTTEIETLRRATEQTNENASRIRVELEQLRVKLAQLRQMSAARSEEVDMLRRRESTMRETERGWDQKIASAESAFADRQGSIQSAASTLSALRRQLDTAEDELRGRRAVVVSREAELKGGER